MMVKNITYVLKFAGGKALEYTVEIKKHQSMPLEMSWTQGRLNKYSVNFNNDKSVDKLLMTTHDCATGCQKSVLLGSFSSSRDL